MTLLLGVSGCPNEKFVLFYSAYSASNNSHSEKKYLISNYWSVHQSEVL